MTVATTDTFRAQELAWAKKQIEYARFERKQRNQANDLVWIVKAGGKYQVTERGQLWYAKGDAFTNRDEAIAEANKRLVARLAVEDLQPNNYVRTVVMRDKKEDL
jgi:hypothetical protein